jgi:hypothetical protein
MNAGEFTSGLIRHVRHLERRHSGDDALGAEARVIWTEGEHGRAIFVVLSSGGASPPVVYALRTDGELHRLEEGDPGRREALDTSWASDPTSEGAP